MITQIEASMLFYPNDQKQRVVLVTVLYKAETISIKYEVNKMLTQSFVSYVSIKQAEKTS